MAVTDNEFRSNLEQAEAGFERIAKIMEAYYLVLRETEIEAPMIDQMMIAFQKHWLDCAFPNPNEKKDA